MRAGCVCALTFLLGVVTGASMSIDIEHLVRDGSEILLVSLVLSFSLSFVVFMQVALHASANSVMSEILIVYHKR